MTPQSRDPLLAIARAVITLAMGIGLVFAAALAIAMPALLLTQDRIAVELAGRGRPIDGTTIAGIEAALLLLIAIVVIVFLTLRLLRRIIDTVGAGDPFVPANADRLAQMGWLTLATQALALVIGLLAAWLESRVVGMQAELSFSFGAILLALVLFILARVFRTGAAMREELEGTV